MKADKSKTDAVDSPANNPSHIPKLPSESPC